MLHISPRVLIGLVVCVLPSLQGDPSAAPYAVDNAKAILGKKPVFGICMGHQILGQAFGGKTFKLKFGHHGGNHPIRHNPSGVCWLLTKNNDCCLPFVGRLRVAAVSSRCAYGMCVRDWGGSAQRGMTSRKRAGWFQPGMMNCSV